MDDNAKSHDIGLIAKLYAAGTGLESLQQFRVSLQDLVDEGIPFIPFAREGNVRLSAIDFSQGADDPVQTNCVRTLRSLMEEIYKKYADMVQSKDFSDCMDLVLEPFTLIELPATFPEYSYRIETKRLIIKEKDLHLYIKEQGYG